MKICIVIMVLLTSIALGHAQTKSLNRYEIGVRAKLMDAHISTVMGKTRLALLGLSDLLSRTVQTDEELHKILKNKAIEVGHIREILYLDRDGVIIGDSSRLPATPLNLSEREYFQNAKNSNRGSLEVGNVLIGKNSGFPFIPLSARVEFNGKFIGVLVAILTPEELLKIDAKTRCELCLSIISKTDGTMLEQFPNVEGLNEFVNSFSGENRASSGYAILKAGELDAKVAWITHDNHPIISIHLEFIRK